MTDLEVAEFEDAFQRHGEGGGAVPTYLHGMLGVSTPVSAPEQKFWYKNPLWWGIFGLGLAAVAGTIYLATRSNEDDLL